MVITAALVLLGVKNGIEKSCKIMMPMLFIAMLVLIVRSSSARSLCRAR